MGLGEGELGRERDLSVVRMSELFGEREREKGLNVVGPLKTVQPSSTGQTGWSDRSDRWVRPVRPVQPGPSQVWQRIQLLVCHIDLRFMCRD